MIVSTPLAVCLGIMLCATDLLLIRLRRLPTGKRALGMSAVASVLVGTAYALHRPGQYGELLSFALALVVPMVVVAVLTRALLGERP